MKGTYTKSRCQNKMKKYNYLKHILIAYPLCPIIYVYREIILKCYLLI